MKQHHQVRLAAKKMAQIERLLERGDTDRIDKILAGEPMNLGVLPNSSGLKYLLARLEEEWVVGGEDGIVALGLFSELAEKRDEFLGEALIGQARILYRVNKEKNLKEIISLCKEAVDVEQNSKAMLMLGSIFENDCEDYELAGRWYLCAYRHGLPWGLRWYAKMQGKLGRSIRSMLAHVATTISSPFMVAWHGLTGPYK